MDINGIRRLTKEGKYHYSNHAKERILLRDILERTVLDAILSGEILEEYEDDVRGKSYLLLGKGPIHVLVGYNKYVNKTIAITVYIPEPPKWVTSKKRGTVK